LRLTTKKFIFFHLLGLIVFIGFGTIFAKSSDTAPLKKIKISSDDWCPYICPDTLRDKGLITEVVTAALKEVGLKTEYIYTKSWKRAIQNVTLGDNDILLDAAEEHRDILDFAANFYVVDESVFVILKDSNITLNYRKDLWKHKLGVIEGYVYYEQYGPWAKHISEHPNTLKINQSLGEAHLLELLARKRIDITVLNWDVARYKLNEAQVKKFRIIEKEVSSFLYLGFTRSDRGRKIKKLFEQGFNRLIGTEKIKNIYIKYHIEMPDFSITE
jgi:polar amino acid transport system substrate-binding protein